MTLSELIKAAKTLEDAGNGHLPVVGVHSASGAADNANSLYLSDHVGDEGPFDLNSEVYVAISIG